MTSGMNLRASLGKLVVRLPVTGGALQFAVSGAERCVSG
jgi:hypothetical protein